MFYVTFDIFIIPSLRKKIELIVLFYCIKMPIKSKNQILEVRSKHSRQVFYKEHFFQSWRGFSGADSLVTLVKGFLHLRLEFITYTYKLELVIRRHKINAVAVDVHKSSIRYGNIVTEARAKIPQFFVEWLNKKSDKLGWNHTFLCSQTPIK